MRSSASLRLTVCVLALLPAAGAARAQSAQADYTDIMRREEVLRRDLDGRDGTLPGPLLRRIREVVRDYENVARRYPRSGYSDNALFQAGVLSADAFWQFGEEADRAAALRLLEAARTRYPTTSLVTQIAGHVKRLEAAPRAASKPAVPAAPATAERAALKAIRREALPAALRVTLELEREVTFQDERLEGPPRVFVDLHDTRPAENLKDATLGFPDDIVRQIRVGRHVGATRVVLDLDGAARHSVYTLYNPYRVVIDFERPAPPAPIGTASAAKPPEHSEPGARWTPAGDTAAPPAAPPAAASANGRGGFSLSRQLGLGVSRVVIDPGHGGRDPGAHVKGLNEAELTLDVALRLEKLLLATPGVEVVLTRRTNVYIPLEERTAIANRAAADLFLSIHANASRDARARGIETYFLNFAPNPEAEAIAARENAGSAKTMHNLPDIVKAIALNNKIDESRDFATFVQSSMYERLRRTNRSARNLGVKQAPFMVLIGATMPSVLAEISFLTNRQEASLLRTATYRQAIAEALFAGIAKYQKSLKSAATVATQ